jgi:hypothetical protein
MTFSLTLPTPLDPATNDAWGTTLNTAFTSIEDEQNTKTTLLDFAKFELRRPAVSGELYVVNALGNQTGSVSLDLGNTTAGNENWVTLTLTGDVTLSVTNIPTTSPSAIILNLNITQDGTGGHTVTFPSAFVDQTGANFTISGTDADSMVEVFAYTLDNGTTWYTKQGDTWT